MRTITEQAHRVHQAELAKNEAFRRGDMDACMRHHQEAQELAALPADHALRAYECPFHGKFTGEPLVLTYLSMYTLDAEGNGQYHLQTDYHGAHSITFCPDCAAKVLAHHGKR